MTIPLELPLTGFRSFRAVVGFDVATDVLVRIRAVGGRICIMEVKRGYYLLTGQIPLAGWPIIARYIVKEPRV